MFSPLSRTALSLAKVPWSSEDPCDPASCMLVRGESQSLRRGPWDDSVPPIWAPGFPSTLVLGPHYPSLRLSSYLACFTPHVTTRLYTVIIGLSPIPLLHSLNTSLQVPCVSVFCSLISPPAPYTSKPGLSPHLVAILLSWCVSPVWAAGKYCGSRGLKATDVYSSQFWWLEFKIKVPQIPCLIRPHTSFLHPHLWGLLYKGAIPLMGASRVAQR